MLTFFTLLLFLSPSRADILLGRSCPFDRMFPDTAFNQSVIRPLEMAALDSDPTRFCDSAMAVRFLSSHNAITLSGKPYASDLEIRQALADGKLEQLINDKIPDAKKIGTVWEQSLIPTEAARLLPLQQIAVDTPGAIERKEKINLDKSVQILSMPACESQKLSREGETVGDAHLNVKSVYDFNHEKIGYKYACQELLGLKNLNRCDKSFEKIREIATPNSNFVSGGQIFSSVLYDRRYNEGLRLAALQIADRTQKKTENESDLFSDFKSAFEKSGATTADAQEMTWKSIAIIASSGPNLAQRFTAFNYSKDQFQKRLALNTIANALPILDHRSSRRGHTYSFPPSVVAKCNTGKAYHFWYIAYMAREAAKHSGDVEAAAAAAFQSEKAYAVIQRGSYQGTSQTKNAETLKKASLYSPASEVVRGDIAYAAAGAIYGAASSSGEERKLNVDAGLSEAIKNGNNGSSGVLLDTFGSYLGSTASAYKDWSQKFSPNSMFTKMNNGNYKQVARASGMLAIPEPPKCAQ